MSDHKAVAKAEWRDQLDPQVRRTCPMTAGKDRQQFTKGEMAKGVRFIWGMALVACVPAVGFIFAVAKLIVTQSI